MATPNDDAIKFLQWADSEYSRRNPNAKITNLEKLNSRYILREYSTWKEVYDAALKDYYESGGEGSELGKYSPSITTRAEKTAAKTKAEEDALRFKADPFQKEVEAKNIVTTVDPNNGKTFVADGESNELFFYGTYQARIPKKTERGTNLKVYSDFGQLRTQILSDAAKNGTTDKLFEDLYKQRLISKDTFDKKNFANDDFNKGLVYALREYSVKVLDEHQLNVKLNKPVVNAPLFSDYLSKEFGGLADPITTSTQETSTTLRHDAVDDVNRYFMANLGRGATKQEKDLYYKELRDAERKSVRTRSVTTDALGNTIAANTTGELLSDVDKQFIFGKIASKAIKGSNLDILSKSGGKAAQDIADIMNYANNYGVMLSQQDAMEYIASNYKKGTDKASTEAKLREISKSIYSNFSDKISDQVSVRSLATNYIYNKANVLELDSNSINVFDKDINDALLNKTSMTDFNKQLKSNPAWSKTKNAREEASSYAYSILQSFGLMG
jgi:predicted adenine nucleotide alpha hydrolase (AANH) superfamily ATPase